MSRTYRKRLISFCTNCNKPHRFEEKVKDHPEHCNCHQTSNKSYSYGYELREVKCHDHKPWYKPPKWFKQDRERIRRSQYKQALHKHVYKGMPYTPPVNKKTDVWNWT